MGDDPPRTAEGGAFRAQDLVTTGDPVGLDGTLVRVDTSGAALADNPLAGDGDPNAERIVAFGLRNPFRFTFRPGTDELWIGDVGWGTWEEIDVVRSTTTLTNFGRPCYEGDAPLSAYRGLGDFCDAVDAHPVAPTGPWFAYHHDERVVVDDGCRTSSGSAITGLAFEEGADFPVRFDGALFFTDYQRGCIWVMPLGADGDPDPALRERFADLSDLGPDPNQTGAVELRFGPDGALHWVDLLGGAIHRIRSSTNLPPEVSLSAVPTWVPTPLTVDFDASASSDSEGGALSFAWDLDGDGEFDDAAGPIATWTYTNPGSVTAAVEVSDLLGRVAVDDVLLSAQNNPPTAVITGPDPARAWAVGDRIAFSGVGEDPNTGPVDPSAMRWTVNILDCATPDSCATRFVERFEGVAGGTITAADWIDADYLEFVLHVTDPGGLEDEARVRIAPRRVDLTITSEPVGVTIAFGEHAEVTPFLRDVITGSVNTVVAPKRIVRDGVGHVFVGWSDGGPRVRDLVAPGSAVTLVARYRPASVTAMFVDETEGRWYPVVEGVPQDPFYFGDPGDVPFVGDWDCDGVDTPGLYRRSDGYVYLRNSNSQGVADVRFFFGNPGDLPLAGDFDGDGCDTVSIWRPSEARVYIINELGENDGGLGAAEVEYYFGNPGDQPFVGDFDADGIDTIGLYRESTGFVYFRNSHTQGVSDRSFVYGNPGDRIVAGDWTGAGAGDTVAVFRPGVRRLLVRYHNGPGFADAALEPPGPATVAVSYRPETG